MNELVSIIIPTYNTNDSLERAINSVLSQTYKNVEIIVVDDNGKGTIGNVNAKRIVGKYKKNSNVKYYEHEKNINGSAARNTGFKNSLGKFIGFLDDDDEFFNTKIELQIKELIKSNNDLCVCYYKKNNKVIKFSSLDITKNILMLNNVPQTSSFIMKRELYKRLNGFDESYIRHQDFEFLIRAAEIAGISVVKDCLYERHDNGVNNIPNPEKMERVKDKFLLQFDYLIKKYGLSRKLVYGKNYGYVSFLYLKNKKIEKAFQVMIYKGNFTCVYFLAERIIIGIVNKIWLKFRR